MRRCHSRCVLDVGLRTPPQEWDTTGAAWGRGAILLQIDKQRVRVFKLTIFKLTLCSIAKFELLVMQYEHNIKAHVYIQSNINRHIKQLH